MNTRPVYYSQLDSHWRNYLYDINPSDGDDYLKSAGCGPTTAAMVAAQFVDHSVTPPDMADFAIAHGDRTATNGTAETLFKHLAEAYGLPFLLTYKQAPALQCLDDGGLVACHVGKGRWTSGGHYILWWGYGDGNCYINDPSGDTAKRNTGTLAELQKCRKAYLCFWPKEEEETMTQDQFNTMMDTYLSNLAEQEPSGWSAEARAWAEENGVITGDENGNKKYKAPCTREQMVQFLYRVKG